MPAPAPHFHLLAETGRHRRCGDWRFVLQAVDGRRQLEVEDAEPAVKGERLELLAVVRGLEALDQPSRVTLLTRSSYISKGLQYGLDEWRANNWQWERHGEMVPVKNGDLWRRIDHALRFHDVDCRIWRVDTAHSKTTSGNTRNAENTGGQTAHTTQRLSPVAGDALPCRVEKPESKSPTPHGETLRRRRRRLLACLRRCREMLAAMRLRLAQFGTDFLPRPWFD